MAVVAVVVFSCFLLLCWFALVIFVYFVAGIIGASCAYGTIALVLLAILIVVSH